MSSTRAVRITLAIAGTIQLQRLTLGTTRDQQRRHSPRGLCGWQIFIPGGLVGPEWELWNYNWGCREDLSRRDLGLCVYMSRTKHQDKCLSIIEWHYSGYLHVCAFTILNFLTIHLHLRGKHGPKLGDIRLTMRTDGVNTNLQDAVEKDN